MKKLILVLTVLLLTLLPHFSFAAVDNPIESPWREKETYGDQALSKLAFGGKNFLLGWTELFTEPVEQGNPIGIVQGLGNAVMDTAGGFLHVITAPLTGVDVPLPENGVNF
jgi:hypothetical protein